MGLCCLSTEVSAIPELITDGETGRLVQPGDPAMLAKAIADLIRDPAERNRLGTALVKACTDPFRYRAGPSIVWRRSSGKSFRTLENRNPKP